MAAMADGREERATTIERWAPLSGILYVVLFVVGLIVSESGQPDGDAPPAEVIRYYSSSSHRDRIGLASLLMLVGFFFFVWFVGVLVQEVRRQAGDGLLPRVTAIGGAVYVTLGMAGSALSVATRTMSDDTYHHQVYPELIHLAGDAGYVLHSAGGAGLGAAMIAVGLALLRSRALAPWVAWLSVVAGIAAIFSIFFIPWIVIAVWLVVASVVMFVAEGRRAAAPASTS